MPARNSLKTYIKNGFYHIYNRGVDKRNIFIDEQDYKMFLYYLKVYLLSKEDLDNDSKKLQGTVPCRIKRKNFFSKINLLSYCLMPNHFHLLIKQKDVNDISNFMKCLLTNYSMYFNRKYDRSGVLFQGRYKAVNVNNSNYLLRLSRYIHANPAVLLGTVPSKRLQEYDYSSYQEYLGIRNTKWIKSEIILDIFSNNQYKTKKSEEYKKFVEDSNEVAREILGRLSID